VETGFPKDRASRIHEQKTAAAGLSSSRCYETPLKAPRESKEADGAASIRDARDRRYFFIFFFFFGLLAMVYFLLSVMNVRQG
jgi:hypothetical protein